ncbi:PRC-barrel domain-containing protein [Pedobacter sp. P351]|uniref:PRC-barrel domain-containing protein n=1 Tax=Pedobacter superstes TaxID=3133441 RepID=UPI0030B30A5F
MYSLIGFTIWATDGEIGRVKNFYFDDETWKIRYLIVKTGSWLFGRKVLVSPVALKTPFWDAESFPVNLSKDQVRNSPDIDTEKPVSRQQEQDLHHHYSWPYDDNSRLASISTGTIGGVIPPSMPSKNKISEEVRNEDDFSDQETSVAVTNSDPHLRSFKEVVGYKIFTSEHKIGRVDDFLMDNDWSIPYMVIETGKWHPGKRIVTSTGKVQRIEWKDSSVFINEKLDSLKNSLEYDYTQLTNQSFERNLIASFKNPVL